MIINWKSGWSVLVGGVTDLFRWGSSASGAVVQPAASEKAFASASNSLVFGAGDTNSTVVGASDSNSVVGGATANDT